MTILTRFNRFLKCLLPPLLLFYSILAQGSNDICDFLGKEEVPDPKYLEEHHFHVLLWEEKCAPSRIIFEITKIVGKVAVTDADVLKSPSCKITKYVAALINYYDKNKKEIQEKHKDIASLLDFIKSKLKDKNESKIIGGENHEEL